MRPGSGRHGREPVISPQRDEGWRGSRRSSGKGAEERHRAQAVEGQELLLDLRAAEDIPGADVERAQGEETQMPPAGQSGLGPHPGPTISRRL